MSKPRQTVKIDITPENFPNTRTALQNFSNEAAKEAVAFVQNLDVPDDAKSDIYPIVYASLLRDAIYKLTEGADTVLEKAAPGGQLAHFIKKGGTMFPASITPPADSGDKSKLN